MELNIQTILIIAVVVIGLFWLKDNQPETYDSITGVLKDIWDGITGLFKSNDQQDTTEGTVEGDKINYGQPYKPILCVTDDQCQQYFDEIDNIKCNMTTGECYAEQ